MNNSITPELHFQTDGIVTQYIPLHGNLEVTLELNHVTLHYCWRLLRRFGSEIADAIPLCHREVSGLEMASGNKVADIFYSEVDYADTALTKPLAYGFPPLFGFCSVIVLNYVTRRPVLSGIQKHIAAAAIGLGAGHWMYTSRRKRHARRDAIYRHYILLHPEDFPEEKPKKFKDILLPWSPVRPGG